VKDQGAIFAPACDDAGQWPVINRLRTAGEVVVCGFKGQSVADVNADCDRQLVCEAGQYQVKSL